MSTQDAKRPAYIAIARKAFESDTFWLEKRVFSRWEAWQDLIQLAGWKPRQWAIPSGPVIQLARGETQPLSLAFLSDRWGWGIKRVRIFIKLCCALGRIRAQRRAHQGQTYVIVNYDHYQAGGHKGGHTEGMPQGTARAQQGHNTEAGKKESKESEQTILKSDVPAAPPTAAVVVEDPDRSNGNRKAVPGKAVTVRRDQNWTRNFLALLTTTSWNEEHRLRTEAVACFEYWRWRFKVRSLVLYTDSREKIARRLCEQYGLVRCLFAIEGQRTHPDFNPRDGEKGPYHKFDNLFRSQKGPAAIEKCSEWALEKQEEHHVVKYLQGLEQEKGWSSGPLDADLYAEIRQRQGT